MQSQNITHSNASKLFVKDHCHTVGLILLLFSFCFSKLLLRIWECIGSAGLYAVAFIERYQQTQSCSYTDASITPLDAKAGLYKEIQTFAGSDLSSHLPRMFAPAEKFQRGAYSQTGDICKMLLFLSAPCSPFILGNLQMLNMLSNPSETNLLPVLARQLLYLPLYSGLKVTPPLTDKKQVALPC